MKNDLMPGRSFPFIRSQQTKGGFTLVELLVATVVLLLVMGIVFSITQETSHVWKKTTGKVESFRNARAAFEAMTRTLSQATLNTYYDYVDSSGKFRGTGMDTSGNITQTFTPYTYARQSDLHLICGQGSILLPGMTNYTAVTHALFFQAPLGSTTSASYSDLDKLLNACGFYVAYGPDPSVPNFLGTAYPTTRYRYRLMQFTQSSEALSVYQTPGGVVGATAATQTLQRSWFTSSITPVPSTTANAVLAENIVALVIWPKRSIGDQTPSNSLTSDYSYDSRDAGTFSSTTGFPETFNQLPPVFQITMVAIDEASAIKLGNTTLPPNTQVGLTSTIFSSATYPTTAGQQNQLQIDLEQMKGKLSQAHMNFRVFQTEVSVRGAKWTTK